MHLTTALSWGLSKEDLITGRHWVAKWRLNLYVESAKVSILCALPWHFPKVRIMVACLASGEGGGVGDMCVQSRYLTWYLILLTTLLFIEKLQEREVSILPLAYSLAASSGRFLFTFLQCWGVNSWPHACLASVLPFGYIPSSLLTFYFETESH